MDPYQIKDTIDLIREEYHYYKPDDFKLFFKMAKKGYFGQVFGRMDGEVIMNWLIKYDQHRYTMAETQSIKEADKFKPLVQEETRGVTFQEYLEYKRQKK